ncbi:ATP-dependent DNA helicase [Leucobacter tardus]|uniref:DNA 3'-5' helicase n=1 Tax=Leucobacter tardus TaxID=501483 RepID=A0A939TR35_9MICO|nr:ATP-dependent DNA helicase [Leucobacter tardus]MBO2989622.1 ATP-dependent helicase [Leucobacter tardus]
MSVEGHTEAAFSAVDIAKLMADDPAAALLPTDEQRAVIEHGLNGSTLVVAGAGSGKTETMANRVVWLIANGLADPGAILGLTFTRKAAGELGERIVRRLTRFLDRVTDAADGGALSELQRAQADHLASALEDGLVQPEVSTYNAFASSVVQEFGVAAGVAASATVVDAAGAWRLARETVLASEAPGLIDSDIPLPTIIRRVIDLDHAVSDHLTSLDRVDAVVAEFARIIELPYSETQATGRGGKPYKAVADAVEAHRETPLISRLAREFAAAKERNGVVEFSDQVRLAMRTLEYSRDARTTVRRRHRVVLLDEVQDTSVGQTRLLASLFSGSSVMAVGDPHQSIYGWRGASSDNLRRFHASFAPTSERSGSTLTLSTSWRNPAGILAAANVIAAPLIADAAVPVEQLRAAPHTGDGVVDWKYPETVTEEFSAVAEWVATGRARRLRDTGRLPTAAVLFRNRRHMPAVAAALGERGVPSRIIGVGGLLGTPEVTDVVSTLRCLWYAEAGSELIRLLAGPRFRIGVADLDGLRRCATWFSERDASHQRLTEADLAERPVLSDADQRVTLLDALDEIADMRDLDHRSLAAISAVGRERLCEAGRMLRRLRRSVGAGIPELIRAVEHELRLDIELDAHERSGHDGSAVARANLDAFTDLVQRFLTVDQHGTLASVLAWLERATEDDEPAEHVPEPEPGTVDLITVHGSKGLEWDLVALPRMVTGEFPGPSREGRGWLRPGQLPDELRGDASGRPELRWRIAETQQDLHRAINGYTEGRGEDAEYVPGYLDALAERHAAEERRLAYVAITRSADALLLSGSFWAGQQKPRIPSTFLRELDAAGIISGVPEASRCEADPSDRPERTLSWPQDPLGRRAAAVQHAAESVCAELASDTADGVTAPSVDPTVELLIAEKRSSEDQGARGRRGEGAASGRITASGFHEFIDDPERADRQARRPLPVRPYRRTRVGNRFHEWVERRATTAIGTALPLGGLEPESDEVHRTEFDGAAELAPLIAHFERSRWANLQPIAVEQEITLPFAGRQLVCKLDAVYRVGSGEESRIEIVDWKSGRPPKSDAERTNRLYQLELYRHAYARWADLSPDRIDVSLYYVAEDIEIRGTHHLDFAALEQLWFGAAESL